MARILVAAEGRSEVRTATLLVRSLRFCHLTTFYPPYSFGGDAVGVQRLCRALARRGHEVTVVYEEDAYSLLSRGAPPSPPDESDGVTRIGLRAARSPGLRSLASRDDPGGRLGAISTLLTHQLGRPVVHAKLLKELLAPGRFDVVNFHNASLVGGPGVFGYGDALKLYMAHEHWLVCPTHVLWRHGKEACNHRECLRCVWSYRRPPQPWRWFGALERQGAKIDAFIAMSEFSREKHRAFGFPFEMEVLPYFLPDPTPDTGAASGVVERPQLAGPGAAAGEPDASVPNGGRPYFLFVGRLERIKGLDDVLPIFRTYAHADLLIAGDGDYAETLRGIAGDCPRIRFLGRVGLEELRAYYRHAIALIVPSVCFETFGIILIESFREATPVIARRIGPFPEIVDKAGAGDLFETEAELVAALQRIQGDEALRRERSERAYRAYQEHWSESAVVPRYLDLIGRLAVRNGRTELAAALGFEGARASTKPAHASDDAPKAGILHLHGAQAQGVTS